MLTLSSAGGVATVTLDRPPVNAWDDYALDQLDEITAHLLVDCGASLVVVRSAHGHFSAGGDIAMMAEAVARRDVTSLDRFAARIQRAFRAWADLPIPTVAVLRGAVTGGGLEFALSCDLRIASETCRIGLPESRLGLVAAGGGTQRLVAAIGHGAAMRLMLTADLVDGRRAADLGLVEQCVPDVELDDCVEDLVARICRQPGTALRAIKACVSHAGGPEGFAMETRSQRALHAMPDTQRRLQEFAESRRSR